MAVIDKTSSWYSLRGKVGGLCVSSNGQASYVKALRPPNPSKSPLQTEQRLAWATLFGVWRSLGAVIQGLWKTAAAGATYVRYDWYGQPYHMSGMNLFFAINRVTLEAFGTYQLAPPAAGTPAGAPASTFALRSSTNILGSDWSTAAPWDASIAALRLRAHASFNGSQLTSTSTPKLVVYWLRSIGSPLSITSALEASFGKLPLSYRMFFSVAPVTAEGRIGTELTYSVASLGV